MCERNYFLPLIAAQIVAVPQFSPEKMKTHNTLLHFYHYVIHVYLLKYQVCLFSCGVYTFCECDIWFLFFGIFKGPKLIW